MSDHVRSVERGVLDGLDYAPDAGAGLTPDNSPRAFEVDLCHSPAGGDVFFSEEQHESAWQQATGFDGLAQRPPVLPKQTNGQIKRASTVNKTEVTRIIARSPKSNSSIIDQL